MIIGIPAEVAQHECRVAATPDTVARLIQELGFEVLLQSGAGEPASFRDEDYASSGGRLVETANEVFSEAHVLLKVRAPTLQEAAWLTADKTLISFVFPGQHPDLLQTLAESQASVLAMDAVPRISRAQKMDALSSMANIAGYRAVVEAASAYGRFFTGQITAAGKVPPAKVLIIGAGVAGLAAIGAARGLGAIVRAFDVRPEVADQVQSMGAEFLYLDFGDEEQAGSSSGYAQTMSDEFIAAEMALFAEQAREVDIIITTALIPGKPAPTLITRSMVDSMRPGSVIVDLATEQGGNCEVSVRDEVILHQGVHVIGYSDLPSRLPSTSSQLYGTNLFHVLDELGGSEHFHINLDDEVLRSMTVVHQGKVTWPPPPVSVSATPHPAKETEPVKQPGADQKSGQSLAANMLVIALAVLALVGLGFSRDGGLLTDFTVFALACLVGWQVIWNVTAALHTPLMSVTNAISGIIIVGGLVQVGTANQIAAVLGAAAIFFATINIAGGFLVTARMLKMFHK